MLTKSDEHFLDKFFNGVGHEPLVTSKCRTHGVGICLAQNQTHKENNQDLAFGKSHRFPRMLALSNINENSKHYQQLDFTSAAYTT